MTSQSKQASPAPVHQLLGHLIEQYDRLNGTNLSRKGSPLKLAIDDASGRTAADREAFLVFFKKFCLPNSGISGSDPPNNGLGGSDQHNQPEKHNETKETK
jgi:hypothetical protein